MSYVERRGNVSDLFLKKACEKIAEGLYDKSILEFVFQNQSSIVVVNPLSANPTKWSNTLKQFIGFEMKLIAGVISVRSFLQKWNFISGDKVLCKRYPEMKFYHSTKGKFENYFDFKHIDDKKWKRY